MANKEDVTAENFITSQLADMGVSSSSELPAPPATAQPVAAPAAKPAPVAATPPGAIDSMSLAGLANAALAAAGVTPAPATEPAAADADPEPEQADPVPADVAAGGEKSGNAWTKIKRENKELRTKLAEFEHKLKAGDPEQATKLQKMEEQLAEYEDKLGRLDLTQSKSFKAKYESTIDQLRARSVQVVARVTERSPEEAAAFVAELEKSDMPALRQILADEPQAVQGALIQNLIEIQEAQATRDRAISDWKNSKSALEVGKGKDEEAEQLRQITAHTTAALQSLSAKPEDGGEGSWIFQDQPENPQWQEQKTNIISAARAALRDRKDVPKLVMEGIAAGVYRKLAEQLYHQVQELQGAVSARDRVRPKVNGRAPEPRRAAPVSGSSDPQSFVEDLMR